MSIFNIVLLLLGLTPFTWVQYLSIMNLKRNRDKLTKPAKVIAYPLLVIGLITDMIYNIVVGSILFVEPPKELLFTSRLKRHINESTGWKQKLALWFCKNFLNPFDPDPDGNHCN